MTREKLDKLIAALIAMRDSATDEQAIAAKDMYKTWTVGITCQQGARLLYNDKLYTVLQTHDSQAGWEPDKAPSLFAEVLPGQDEDIGEWVQPDSTNPYMIGDRVTHNGSIWESTVDNNVWEPGVYGWQVVEL